MKHKKRMLTGLLSATVVLALASTLAITPAGAHGGNHGTIKVHDEETADPDQRNEPHVDCDFWIEGFNMDGSAGTLVIYSWPPTGDKSEVLEDTWTGSAEEDGDGFHFLSGPYELDSGHYRVEAFSTEGHPGDHGHFAKAKMFWVECDVDAISECPPTALSATALADGDVLLEFEAPPDATGLNIYRAEGSGEFEYVTTVNATTTSYLDTTTEVGTTYTYTVNPLFGDVEAQNCEEVTVTAIPVFTTAIAAGAAATLGLLGYAVVGRRR